MLNIEIDKTKAQAQVDELGNSILALGDKAEEASKKVGQRLDFSSFARKEMNDLKKSFQDMNTLLASVSQGFDKANKSAQQHFGANQTGRAVLAGMSQALNQQTNALKNQTVVIKNAITATQQLGVAQGKAAAAARQPITPTIPPGFFTQLRLGQQLAAGFRAGLQGLGLGFGAFTGTTVLAASAVYGLTKAIRESLAVGAEFSDVFVRVAAAADGLNTVTGEFTPNAKRLRDMVISLGQTSRFSSKEVGEAALALAQAGQKTGEIISTLPSVLNMATIDRMDTASAAEKLINVLTVYKKGAKDAAEVTDMLVATSLASTTTIQQLGTAMGQAGSVAAEANVPMRDTLSVLALLRQVGISASKSGTDLRNMIISLSAPSKKAGEALRKMGLDANSFWNEDGFKLEETLERVAAAFKKMTVQQQTAASSAIFDRRTAGAVLSLTNQIDKLKEFNKEIEYSTGIQQRLADIINNNAKAKMEQLGNTIGNIAIRAFDQYADGFVKNLTMLIAFLNQHKDDIAKFLADTATAFVYFTRIIIQNADLIFNALQKTFTAMTSSYTTGFVWDMIFPEATKSAYKFTDSLSDVRDMMGSLKDMDTGTFSKKFVDIANDMETAAKRQKAAAKAYQDNQEIANKSGPAYAAIDFTKQLSASDDALKKSAGLAADLADATNDLKIRQALYAEAVGMSQTALGDWYQLMEKTWASTHKGEGGLGALTDYFSSLQHKIEDLLAPFRILFGMLEKLPQISAIFESFTGFTKNSAGGFSTLLSSLGKVKSAMQHSYTINENDYPPDNGIHGPHSPTTEEKAEAKARASELASELKKVVDEYEKTTSSVAELSRKMEQLNAIQDALKDKSSAASVEMRKLGLSSAEVGKALDQSAAQAGLDYVAGQLSLVDVRFKDLKISTGNYSSAQLTASQTLDEFNKIVAQTPQLQKMSADQLELMRKALVGTASGSTAAQKEFAKLQEELIKLKAESDMPDDSQGLIAYFTNVAGKSKEASESLAYGIRYYKLFGDAIKQSRTESDKLAEASTLLEAKFGKEWRTVAQAVRIYEEYAKTLPTGKMEEENKLLYDRIQLMGQSSEQQYVMNKALETFGSDLHGLSPEFLAAAKANYELNEQMKQMQETQDAFHGFADGLAKVFAGVFDRTTKGFKGLVQGIKEQFKQLLVQLAYMAIRNKIVFALTGQGSGSNGGLWSSIISGFQNMFGMGGGAGSAVVNAVGSNSGAFNDAGGGGTSWGQMVGSAVSNYAGGGGSGSGSFSVLSPSTWKNLASPNYWKSVGQSISSFWSAPLGSGSMVANSPSLFAGQAGPWAGGYVYPGQGVGYATLPSYGGASSYGVSGYPAGYANGAMYGGVAGGLMGLYAGSKTGNGGFSTAAGTVTYGLAGATLGAAAGSILATGSIAGAGTAVGAGAATMGASAGFAAAIPIIGWIAVAAMLINMFSGGKLFGNKFRTQSVTQGFGVGANGGKASLTELQVRDKALFAGREWKGKDLDVPDEMQRIADRIFSTLKKTMSTAAHQVGIDMIPVIDASWSTVTEYDKKGKKKSEKQITEYMGKTYEESFEDFQKRINAEGIIAVVDKAAGATGEASKIAERWRDNIDLLVDGASFLLQAQTDIHRNMGLLQTSGPGSLEKTTTLIEELQNANESMVDAYARVKASVVLVDSTLGQFGANLGRSREEYVKFSANLVDALGGLSEAQTKLATFAQAFGSYSGVSDFTASASRANRSTLLGNIGLDADTTAEQFIAAFQDAMKNQMSAEDTADWIEAGNVLGQISLALKAMKDQAQGTGDTLREQVDNQIRQIKDLGASEAELAQARDYGNKIIQKAIADFMNGIEGQLAEFEGRTHVYKLKQITDQMNENIRQAELLGVSEQQLSRIRQLAAYQTMQVMNELRTSITSLVKTWKTDPELADQQQKYAEAQQQAAQDLYDKEMQRYDDAQAALKKISDFLKSLSVGELNPGGWDSRLNSGKSNFLELLAKAKAGDKDALDQITGSAQDYLDLAHQYYGTTRDYDDIYQFVTNSLKDLGTDLGKVTAPGAHPGGGSSSSSSSTVEDEAQKKQDRYNLALQIAQQIGELGIATKASVFDIAKQFGVDLKTLAKDLGIDLNHIDITTGTSLEVMAGALGISIADLADSLGLDPKQLQQAFGTTAKDIVDGNTKNLKQLVTAMGGDLFAALSLLGIDIKSLASDFGVDLTNITKDSITQLAAMATALGVGFPALAAKLDIPMSQLIEKFGVKLGVEDGANFKQLIEFASLTKTGIYDLVGPAGVGIEWLNGQISDTMKDKVEKSDLPENIKDKLYQYLGDLATADDVNSTDSVLGNIKDFINTLPADQADAVRQWFTDLGVDITGRNGSTLKDIKGSTDATNETATSVKWGLFDKGSAQSYLAVTNGSLVALHNSFFNGNSQYGPARMQVMNWPAGLNMIGGDLPAAMAAMLGTSATSFGNEDGEDDADSMDYKVSVDARIRSLEETLAALTEAMAKSMTGIEQNTSSTASSLIQIQKAARKPDQPSTKSKLIQ